MFSLGIVLALVRLLDDDNAITRQQTALCLARIATGLDNDDQFKIHLRYSLPSIQCLIVSVFLCLLAYPRHHRCSQIIFLPICIHLFSLPTLLFFVVFPLTLVSLLSSPLSLYYLLLFSLLLPLHSSSLTSSPTSSE